MWRPPYIFCPQARRRNTSRSLGDSWRAGTVMGPRFPFHRPFTTVAGVRMPEIQWVCCTASIAAVSSSIPSDLRTHPRTPARKQSWTTFSESASVRISILGSGFSFRISRTPSTPFRFGRQMSKRIRSGLKCLHFSIASRPSAASPQTCQPW